MLNKLKMISKNVMKVPMVELLLFVLGAIFYVTYANYYLPDELPWLTWFGHIRYLDSFLNNNAGIEYFRVTSGENGLFMYQILFLINYYFFDITTRFDAVIHVITVIAFSGMVLWIYHSSIDKKNLLYFFGFILILAISFNTFQISSGAMETQVHMGVAFSLLSFIFVDKVLSSSVSNKLYVITLLIMFLSINIFGAFYSFAGIPLIFIICFANIIRRKFTKQQGFLLLMILVYAISYIVWYRLLGKGNADSGALLSLANILTSPILFIQSIFVCSASAVFGYAVVIDQHITNFTYMTVGAVITAIYLYAIVRYFYNKIYLRTYLPLLMVGYTYFVLFFVLIGRVFDTFWITNFWYTIHTKFALISLVWLLFDDLLSNKTTHFLTKIVSTLSVIFICLMLIYGEYVHYGRIPHEKLFYKDKQQYFFIDDMSNMPIDSQGLTPFALSLPETLNGVYFMQKNKLSVYSNFYRNRKNSDVSNVIVSKYSAGYYHDRWIGQHSEFKLRTGDEGKVIINGYYPAEIKGHETGEVIIDNVTHKFKIDATEFTLTYDAPKNKIIDVKINSNFLFPKANNDERELSFVLSNMRTK